jgi:hypothetical protein
VNEQTEVKFAAAPEPPAATPPPRSPDAPSRGKAYLAERDRTMSLKGKAYLQVADRMYAFRLDYPANSGYQVATEVVEGSLKEKFVVWEARIIDPIGRVIATGRKVEEPPTSAMGCQDWYEKGETGAIGRALGNCGYGTLAALEEDPDRPCDSPRDRGPQRPNQAPQSRPPQPAPRPAAAPAAAAPKPAAAKPAGPAPPCIVCGKPIDNAGRVAYCQSRNLSPSHAEKECSQDPKAKAPIQKGE